MPVEIIQPIQPFKSGERAPQSGKYEIIEATGTATGEYRYATKGDRFPPVSRSGQVYVLREQIHALLTTTTASSAAAIGESTKTFEEALRSLAKK